MRAISRLVDVSINTVTRELVLAGQACADFHDRTVHHLQSKRVQCDEIWSFVEMKEAAARQKKHERKERTGDTWTWTGIDADSKLLISWHVGDRDARAAMTFMRDVASRLASRVQLTTDGHRAYLDAVDVAFGRDIDYAMLVKMYGTPVDGQRRYTPPVCLRAERHVVRGNPDPEFINTSYVERANLTMRMHMRRFTRLTNAFSKKFENYCHMIALYAVWYNFIRIHKTLRVSPAMESGMTDHLLSFEELVAIVDELEASQKANQRVKCCSDWYSCLWRFFRYCLPFGVSTIRKQ